MYRKTEDTSITLLSHISTDFLAVNLSKLESLDSMIVLQLYGTQVKKLPGAANKLTYFTNTANFLMVVSPAVLAHDVSARASDVSMGIAVFPIGWIYSGSFEKLRGG